MRAALRTQILRFAAVGGVGFVVDGGLLWLFISLDVSPYVARAMSFPLAVFVTWLLNRNWTFQVARDAQSKGEFGRYFGVQLVGALTNYGIYSVIIMFFGTAALTVFLGFVAGSAIGAVLNFVGARYIAFRA